MLRRWQLEEKTFFFLNIFAHVIDYGETFNVELCCKMFSRNSKINDLTLNRRWLVTLDLEIESLI